MCKIWFLITGGKTPDIGSRTYTEIMREQMLKGEETEVSFEFSVSCKDNNIVKMLKERFM